MAENTENENTTDEAVAPESGVVAELSPTEGIEPVRPKWLEVSEAEALNGDLEKFVASIKENPADIRLSMEVQKLGEAGTKEILPHTELFDRKLSDVMEVGKEGSPVQTNLLAIKAQLDSVNPAMVAKQPIAVRTLVFLSKKRIPKADEILKIIYERRETVKSTINGLKEGLWQERDKLMQNLADLFSIYEGLLKGQRLVERDIYFGQLLFAEIKEFMESVEDGIARQNIEQLLADLTSVIVGLQTEENSNLQFFAGTQELAKATRNHVSNINRYMSLLERSVLANLGLRVASAELASSVNLTNSLKDAIGQTMVDTASQISNTGKKAAEARSQATINIDKLQEACNILESHFEEMSSANREIIEKGSAISVTLHQMSDRLRQRVEGGHENVKKLADSADKADDGE